MLADRLRHHWYAGFVEPATEEDPPSLHIFTRVTRGQIRLLGPARRLLVEALHAVEPVRYPLDAGFEESHLEPRKALQHPPDHHPPEAHQDRQPERLEHRLVNVF